MRHRAGNRRKLPPSLRARTHVSPKSATDELVEALGDFAFEAEPRDGEKWAAVCQAGIDHPRPTSDEQIECALDRPVDPEVPAQAVAGSTWDQSKRGGRANQHASDFVHRTVATDGNDEFGLFG